MKCIRLEIHDEKGYSSTPYLFCSRCKSFVVNEQFRFCPWCGWEFTNKHVDIVSIDKTELTEKGLDYKNIIEYAKGKVKWE